MVKTVAVTGATGQQGGAVVRALVQRNAAARASNPDAEQFHVRAFVRDPSGARAQAILGIGPEVELVAADYDAPETLQPAFQGADYAYIVTDWWSTHSAATEKAQATALADAAKAGGVKFVVWSSLEDTRKYLPMDSMPVLDPLGPYLVPHMDGKAEFEEYFGTIGLPVAFLVTSAYYENFLTFFLPRPQADSGSFGLTMAQGNAPMAIITTEDIGHAAAAILSRPDTFVGRHITVTGNILTPEEIAQIIGEVVGKTVISTPVPPEVYAQFGFKGADELANMFQFFRDAAPIGYVNDHSLDVWTELQLQPKPFRTWVQEHRSQFQSLMP